MTPATIMGTGASGVWPWPWVVEALKELTLRGEPTDAHLADNPMPGMKV